MKKPKRSFELEEHDLDASGDLGMGLDRHDDEEIIDLDDIVELGEEVGEEEDELDLGVELIDLESDMDFNNFDAEHGSGRDSDLEDDLLGDLHESRASTSARSQPSSNLLEESSEEDLLKQFALGDEDLTESAKESDLFGGEDEPDPLAGLDFGAGEGSKRVPDPEPLLSSMAPSAKEEDVSSSFEREMLAEATVREEEAMVHSAGIQAAVAMQEHEAVSASLDEIVDQIESRLRETVKELVASALPGVVRAVLKEEIEALKRELKSGTR